MADKMITDTEVIEQIRANLPKSTEKGKGLSSPGIFKRLINVNPGESVSLEIAYGLYIINYATTGSTVCFLQAVTEILPIKEFLSSVFSLGENLPGKISIIGENEHKLKIQNNMSNIVTLRFAVISSY